MTSCSPTAPMRTDNIQASRSAANYIAKAFILPSTASPDPLPTAWSPDRQPAMLIEASKMPVTPQRGLCPVALATASIRRAIIMKKTGAWLARYALEQIGIRYTFGIPGVHNTELYDELNASDTITPILVTHEGGGAFMADAVSRLSPSTGCLVVVPA